MDQGQPVSADTIILSELFGPTVQGEGPSTGRRCVFVRTGLCNLACVWCDTPYTWDWKGLNGKVYDKATELDTFTVEHVVQQVVALGCHRTVITGGEPLVQRAAVANLISQLLNCGQVIEVETNGTLTPADWHPDGNVQWNVSPKLKGSGTNHRTEPLQHNVLTEFAQHGANFKFVVCDAADVHKVDDLISVLGLDRSRVWLMPEGRTASEQAAKLADVAAAADALGVNLSGRLHVMTWGDERGR